jgi:hypothetical protein
MEGECSATRWATLFHSSTRTDGCNNPAVPYLCKNSTSVYSHEERCRKQWQCLPTSKSLRGAEANTHSFQCMVASHHFKFPERRSSRVSRTTSTSTQPTVCPRAGCRQKVSAKCSRQLCAAHCVDDAIQNDARFGPGPDTCSVHVRQYEEAARKQSDLNSLSSQRTLRNRHQVPPPATRPQPLASQLSSRSSAATPGPRLAQPMALPVSSIQYEQAHSSPGLSSPIAARRSNVTPRTTSEVDYRARERRVICHYWLKVS